MFLSRSSSTSGTTLVEVTIAAGIAALFLGSLFALNTSSMGTIQMARQSACASQLLQQRVESLRIANWHQVTDANWLRLNVLNSDAAGTEGLKSPYETLTMVPYGSATVGNTQITRNHGVVTVVNQNSALLGENMVKIIWTVAYIGAPNDRPITRTSVALLGKGGVAKW